MLGKNARHDFFLFSLSGKLIRGNVWSVAVNGLSGASIIWAFHLFIMAEFFFLKLDSICRMDFINSGSKTWMRSCVAFIYLLLAYFPALENLFLASQLLNKMEGQFAPVFFSHEFPKLTQVTDSLIGSTTSKEVNMILMGLRNSLMLF